MKSIKLNNIEIPYNISKKKNKNTYFYFKKSGYIQINLSRYQTEKDALNYMKQNSTKFIERFTHHLHKDDFLNGKYMFLGDVYNFNESSSYEITLDIENKVVYSLTDNKDDRIFFEFEKKNMIKILNELKQKYLHNPYVDIKDINLKTRYTTSRHGSCNAKKKNININLHLIKYDKKFIEYVFLHEITHIVHQNHSKDFYELFEKLCPNYKELRSELRQITR